MRVGLLLPNSTFIVRLAPDIRRWFSLGVEDGGATAPDLMIEVAGYNSVPDRVREAAQSLILRHDCEIIVAPLNPAMVAELSGLLSGQQVVALLLTLGEDVVAGDLDPPWAFSFSMGYWRALWLAGHRAAREGSGKAAVLGTLHPFGYGMCAAFESGVAAAGGHVVLTRPLINEDDPDAVARQVADATEDGADTLLVLSSEHEAGPISQGIAALTTPPRIVTMPPCSILPDARAPGAVCAQTTCVSAWDPSVPATAELASRFHAETGRAVHGYALLAYEAGLKLADALKAGVKGGPALAASLTEARRAGPRGQIAFRPDGEQALTFCELEASGDSPGEPAKLQRRSKVDPPPDLDRAVAEFRRTNSKQGWLNPLFVA